MTRQGGLGNPETTEAEEEVKMNTTSTLVETVNINYDQFSESFLSCPTCLCKSNSRQHAEVELKTFIIHFNNTLTLTILIEHHYIYYDNIGCC